VSPVMQVIVQFMVATALSIMVVLLIAISTKVFGAKSGADRLQAIDTATTLLIGIIVLVAAVQRSSLLIDVAIGVAAMGFVGTLAIARYIAEGKLF